MRPDLAEQFIHKGREDETLLERIAGDESISDSIFGFHAQQALEKYVKAVLARFEVKVPKSHDLAYLIGQAVAAGASEEIDLDRADTYTVFAVEDRYPFIGVGLPEAREETIGFVRQVRTWAERITTDS